MKIEKIELTKLSADDGKAITKDGETFYKDKYLAPTENVEDWYEVDEPENKQ